MARSSAVGESRVTMSVCHPALVCYRTELLQSSGRATSEGRGERENRPALAVRRRFQLSRGMQSIASGNPNARNATAMYFTAFYL